MVALEEADTLGYYMGDILRIKKALGVVESED